MQSDGTAIPATGYRAIGGDANVTEAGSGVIDARNPTYLTFDNIMDLPPETVKDLLQLPRLPTHSVSFDTVQILDDIRVPGGRWNTTEIPEPVAQTFPEWGGGGTQAITNSPIKIDGVQVLPKGPSE